MHCAGMDDGRFYSHVTPPPHVRGERRTHPCTAESLPNLVYFLSTQTLRTCGLQTQQIISRCSIHPWENRRVGRNIEYCTYKTAPFGCIHVSRQGEIRNGTWDDGYTDDGYTFPFGRDKDGLHIVKIVCGARLAHLLGRK